MHRIQPISMNRHLKAPHRKDRAIETRYAGSKNFVFTTDLPSALSGLGARA